MAPSQIEHQQEQTLGQGYTHKKFNWGYSHKKLGLRFRQREQENKKNLPQPQNQEIKNNNAASKDLFRPYALDDNNTPRKRKISRSSESSEETCTAPLVSTPQTSPITYQQQPQIPLFALPSPALSPNSYGIRLQRLRAALYMRYVAQMQQQTAAVLTTHTSLQTVTGYPNVVAPLFNGC